MKSFHPFDYGGLIIPPTQNGSSCYEAILIGLNLFHRAIPDTFDINLISRYVISSTEPNDDDDDGLHKVNSGMSGLGTASVSATKSNIHGRAREPTFEYGFSGSRSLARCGNRTTVEQ